MAAAYPMPRDSAGNDVQQRKSDRIAFLNVFFVTFDFVAHSTLQFAGRHMDRLIQVISIGLDRQWIMAGEPGLDHASFVHAVLWSVEISQVHLDTRDLFSE